MTYRYSQFGSLALPDYNEEADVSLNTAGKSALDLPSGGGLDLYGGEKVMPGSQKVTKTCRLHSATEAGLLTAMAALRAAVGTRSQLYRLNIADDTLAWAYARLDSLRATRKFGQMNKYLQDVTLAFTVFSPAWYATSITHYECTVGQSGVMDLTTVLAESGAGILTVNHTGNVDQAAMVFNVTAIRNTTMVTIHNVNTGHKISYTGTLPAGGVLAIDTGEMSVLVDGVDDYEHFTPPADQENWMRLAPGVNRLVVTITGAGKADLEFYAANA